MPSLRSRLVQNIIRDIKDSFLTEVPLDKRRRQMDEAARRGIRVPREVIIRSAQVGGLKGEWLEPVNAEPERVILYLHGGGYVLGSINTHRGIAARIAQAAHARLLLIEYRLAPEYPFPAALEDASSAFLWLQEQGFDHRKIALGGDSAGGGLTLATTLNFRDTSKPLPLALFLLSPWTDLTFSGTSVTERAGRDPILSIGDEWLENVYAGDYPLNYPLISPVFADLHELPPTLIHVGSEEILFDDSSRLAARLLEVAVSTTFKEWEGMWHVFQAFAPYVPEASQSIKEIGEFLIQQWNNA